MALSLGGGRRRWVCRAARRGGGGRGGPGCRHFHVHYHLSRQVVSFSSLWSPPRFSPLPYLLIPPVLFFAVLAFLVLFGWFTLVYFVSSLLGKGNSHEHGGRKEERAAKRTADSVKAEVCVERQEIKEVFDDGFSDESWDIPRMASPNACTNDEEHSSDEKLVEEVMIFETNWKEFKEISGLDVCSKKNRQQDTQVDSFVEKLGSTEFSTSLNTEKLPDIPSGEEFVANRTELSGYTTSSENFEFVDKHETREVVINAAGNDLKIRAVTSSELPVSSAADKIPEDRREIKQEQSITELPVSSVADKIPGDVCDKAQETQQVVAEHSNSLPEDVCVEEGGKKTAGMSGEAHYSVREMAVSLLNSTCENKFESARASNASFYQDTSDKNYELGEEFEDKRAESPTSASAVCDFSDNHQTMIEELEGFANEDNIPEGGSVETSAIERVEDEDDHIDDICTYTGPSHRLPLVRRSSAPWWNLCGVLDVLAGHQD